MSHGTKPGRKPISSAPTIQAAGTAPTRRPIAGPPSAGRIARQKRRGKVRTKEQIFDNRARRAGNVPGAARAAEAAGKPQLAKELSGRPRAEGHSPGGRPQRKPMSRPGGAGGGIYNPGDLPPGGKPTLTPPIRSVANEDPVPTGPGPRPIGPPQGPPPSAPAPAVIGDPNSAAARYGARRQALSSGQTHLEGQQFSGQGVRDINPATPPRPRADVRDALTAGQPPWTPADGGRRPADWTPEDSAEWNANNPSPGPMPRGGWGPGGTLLTPGGGGQPRPDPTAVLPGQRPDPAGVLPGGGQQQPLQATQQPMQIPYMGYQPPGGYGQQQPQPQPGGGPQLQPGATMSTGAPGVQAAAPAGAMPMTPFQTAGTAPPQVPMQAQPAPAGVVDSYPGPGDPTGAATFDLANQLPGQQGAGPMQGTGGGLVDPNVAAGFQPQPSSIQDILGGQDPRMPQMLQQAPPQTRLPMATPPQVQDPRLYAR